nr:hypothetical protein [Eudoraea chungangensis]
MVAILLIGVSCNEDDEINEECREQKKESCVVTFELDPVCGCNGVTYDNPSTAECNGIDNYTRGACN